MLANVSQMPFLTGNDVELLIDGEATFDSIFDGISRGAGDRLLVQFYIIRDDELGREFADRLIERAKAGRRRSTCSTTMSAASGCPRAYKQPAARCRHQHARLQPPAPASCAFLGPTRINYRNHRKVVVVDGKEAWIGGLNVGDEYMGEAKRFGRWRDTHVRSQGPAVLAARLMFREDWQWATGEELTGRSPTSTEVAGDQSVLVMPTRPGRQARRAAPSPSPTSSAGRAKRLWIVSPYFVPDIACRRRSMRRRCAASMCAS